MHSLECGIIICSLAQKYFSVLHFVTILTAERTMQQFQWLLVMLLATTMSLTAAQNYTNSNSDIQTEYPSENKTGDIQIEGLSEDIVDILRALGYLKNDTKLRIFIPSISTDEYKDFFDIFKDFFDIASFSLLTTPICENEHLGPIKNLVKNGPTFIKLVLTGRWRPIRTKILCTLFLAVKKSYIKLAPYVKLIKLYLKIFTKALTGINTASIPVTTLKPTASVAQVTP